MERGVVVRGRLHGRHIDLDEDLDRMDGDVEVVVRAVAPRTMDAGQTIFDFVRSLPLGTRTKADIDRQLTEEREAWGDR